jgi:glycerol-3-phosphate dehydrogenase subunit C
VKVLNSLGYKVLVPEQNCCGLPLLSNGNFAATKYHQRNITILSHMQRSGIPIVSSIDQLILTLKEEANELLDLFNDETHLISNDTFDLAEFILLHIERSNFLLNLRPVPLTVIYHEPCQYHAQGLGHPGYDLLSSIPELNIIESPIPCCGIAGTYGYKREKYNIAMKIGQPLFNLISGKNDPLILCESETCRWHISQATGKRVVHPIELFALAMGINIEDKLTINKGKTESQVKLKVV